MGMPSLTTILSVVFLAYMANNMWGIAKLYIPPSCASTDKQCLTSSISPTSELTFITFSTTKSRPSLGKDLKYLDSFDVKVEESSSLIADLKLPKTVLNNGTLYLCIFSVPKLKNVDRSKPNWWESVISNPETSYTLTRLTQHSIPQAETFNLLGEEKEKAKTDHADRSIPVNHLRSKIVLSVMTDQVSMSPKQVPGELAHVMSLNRDAKKYLPILFIDELTMRMKDLKIINATDKISKVEILYQPISFGKLRLFLQFSAALGSMHSMGFTDKDTDEVKGIFADTNLVLLLVTFGVSAVHLLFDFLAFKNDVNFWRSRDTVEGLSRKTILWRAFSQSIIFLYLIDEETSLLVLIPGRHYFIN